MFDLKVLKTKISICAADTLTSGMVGEELRVSFSADWDGLNITAVFTDGTHTIDVLNPSEVIVIPHEILADVGARVRVGFYGYTIEDGNIVIAIPTVYAYLGSVKQGADPSGDESTEPSLPVWAQIQSDVNDLENRIDGITQPTKVSQLENDAGYITAEDLPDIPSLDDYAKKQYVDDATTELKEDLASLDERVEELEEHGGQGWTDEQVDLLESIFDKLVYTDAQGGILARQLINSLRGGVIPEEPITITFNGTTATISGLASTNTTFSGTTATIGG